MLLTQLGHDLCRLHRVPPRVVAKPGVVNMYHHQNTKRLGTGGGGGGGATNWENCGSETSL